MTVPVVTCETSCAEATPLAASVCRTVGLWTRSPRIGEWPGAGVLEGERNGVTNAEAHAEVGGAQDLTYLYNTCIRPARLERKVNFA